MRRKEREITDFEELVAGQIFTEVSAEKEMQLF